MLVSGMLHKGLTFAHTHLFFRALKWLINLTLPFSTPVSLLSISCELTLNLLCEVKVTQLCLALCDPMDCSSQGSSVHEILQARILNCVVMPSSRGSSQPRDQTQVSCIASKLFTIWATREAQYVLSEDRYFRQSVLDYPLRRRSSETILWQND